MVSSQPLSDLDRSLLTTLFDPSSDFPATAAAYGLSLLDLAHWLAQPHIQAQVELIESLRALRREIWAEQLRREAAEALREALKEATDPAELRRCANTLLRATSPPRRRPRSSKERVAEYPQGDRKPGEGESRSHVAPSIQPDQSTAPGAEALEPDAQASNLPSGFEIRNSKSLSTAPHIPHSTPHTPHSTPATPHAPQPTFDSRFAQALATLRALGYDTTESELTDEELDALEDAELDAELDEELDAEIDEFADSLTEADIARALALADEFLADRRDTS